MLRELRRRAGLDQGFTLIELLVVILIIGVLAAIAIPSFLNQPGKASDANAKVVARTAETAEETFYTEGQGYIAQVVDAGAAGQLNAIEGTLLSPSTSCVGSPPYRASPCGLTASATPDSYTVSVTSRNGITFKIARDNAGTVTRTCDVSHAVGGQGACSRGGTW